MKNKTVYKKSTFPADINTVFNLLTDLKTLQYIAFPYAIFEPIEDGQYVTWKEGQTFSFQFKLFGFIPYGIHTIHVIDFRKHRIFTNESNTHVPIWNHRIDLKDNGDGTTEYTDEVTINAGCKTILVWLWAKAFYSHRQKKWLKLLKR